jgi:hypothetical protein
VDVWFKKRQTRFVSYAGERFAEAGCRASTPRASRPGVRNSHTIRPESANLSTTSLLTARVSSPACQMAARSGNRGQPTGCTRGGQGVRGPDVDLPGLQRAVSLLRRRAGFLHEQGSPARSAALPRVSGCGQARQNGRRTPRVPHRHLRRVRWAGHRSVRSPQRSAGLLQLLLRQGPRRSHSRSSCPCLIDYRASERKNTLKPALVGRLRCS